MKIAAIDAGSNSIKLVVAERTVGDEFSILRREKDVVRLGHDTLRDRHLAPAAIERAARAIGKFREIAESYGVSQTVAIATASVREADNAAEFVAEVWRQTGVRVEILSGIEEARVIAVAVSVGCVPAVHGGNSFLNIDIGGGSTELSLVEKGVPVRLFSVQLGAVGLTERLITTDPVKPKELRALRDEVAATLDRPARQMRGAQWRLTTGTSGTILAVGEACARARAEAAKGESKNKDEAKDATRDEKTNDESAGREFTFKELERFNRRMAAMSAADRRAAAGLSQQRAEIIVAGGQILEGAMRALKINTLKTCEWALREGVIIDRIREMDAESRPPVPDAVDPRLKSVRELGRRFGYEEKHARAVATLAEKIFDQLGDLHHLNRHQRTLLSAAALLHDIGYAVAQESHHKHSLYLIKNSELTGFSETDRLIVANVARYHRRALPKERHADYVALNQWERDIVSRLGSILRLADALDRSHAGLVRDVHCLMADDSVHIELHSPHACERELWAIEQKRDMFEQTFDRRLICRRAFPSKRA